VRLLVLAVLCACQDQAPSPCAVAPSHQRHACRHAIEGPHAVLDGRLQPPAPVSDPHTLYTITLGSDGVGGFTGQLRFTAPTPGCWALFVSGVERLQAHAACGGPRSFGSQVRVTACRELQRVLALPLASGESITLRLQGGGAQVSLLAERTARAQDADAGPDGAACPEPTEDASVRDALDSSAADGPARGDVTPPVCRASGPCTRDEECCEYCHDGDHCH
jgi:hypothetical protein